MQKLTEKDFLHHLIARILTLILIFPYGLKLHHVFEFHKDVSSCTLTKTHLHKAEPNCDYLDYVAQANCVLPSSFSSILKRNIEPVDFDYYSAPKISLQYYSVNTRGPPHV